MLGITINGQKRGSEAGVSARTWRTLVVDDSKLLHTIVARYLAGTEFVPVEGALDGEEALQRFESLQPDLMMLDVVMPGLSGQETLGRLLGRHPGARVIMVSSVGTEATGEDCLAAGAKRFLVKPFNRAELLNCLRQVVAVA